LVAALLLLAATVTRLASARRGGAELVIPEAMAEATELIEVFPPIEKCSKAGEMCSATKCCTISGYKCYQKNSKWAGCLKECPPKKGSWTCDRPADLVPWKPSTPAEGTTLFCYEVYMADSGSTKKNWELSLIRTQLLTHASVFGCEDWEVYADVTTWLSPGPPQLMTIKVAAPHIGKRPKQGTWLNAAMFINVWADMATSGKAVAMDWTVKADPDAVWLPSRLRSKLLSQEVTDGGIYISNCKHVKYGFFGPLEVISKTGMTTFLDNLEDCKSSLNWGKWGEDLFAQRCMDLHGVDNVEDFTLINDAVCDAIEVQGKTKAAEKIILTPDCTKSTPAFHPLLTPEKYFTCLAATGER